MRITIVVIAIVLSAGVGSTGTTPVTAGPAGLTLGCPDPIDYCHVRGAEATGWCAGEACLQMNYGAEMRVLVPDEGELFPRTWFVWPDKGTSATLLPAGTFPCTLDDSGNKLKVDIPAAVIKCRADLVTDDYRYEEHFVSNPATMCLGWVECRQD